jgi:hypothetical protein
MVVQIDMTPNGEFRGPSSTGGKPPGGFSRTVFRIAVLVAVLTAAGALAALTLWLALTLIPIAIGAAVIAYLMIRFRLWRRRL